MKILDYYFHYKYIGRFILFHKNKLNYLTFNIPKLKKINLFFRIIDLDDLTHLSVSNYVFLIKFFTGRRIFISKFHSFFNLGSYYHNFMVQLL